MMFDWLMIDYVTGEATGCDANAASKYAAKSWK